MDISYEYNRGLAGSASMYFFMRCLFTWVAHYEARLSGRATVGRVCVCVWGIRSRARPRQDIRWPFNYSSGGGARRRTKMADGSFDFAYRGPVIQSTLRALLANNRNPSWWNSKWHYGDKGSVNMKIWPRVHTFTQRCPLDLHTNSLKRTHSSPPVRRPPPWAQKPKAAGHPSGAHQLPWRAKTGPTVADWASVLHYHHRPSFFHCWPAMLAPTIPPACSSKATAKSPATLHCTNQ